MYLYNWCFYIEGGPSNTNNSYYSPIWDLNVWCSIWSYFHLLLCS